MTTGDAPPPPPPPPPRSPRPGGFPSWTPYALLGVAAVLVVVGFVAFGGGDERSGTTLAVSTSTSSTSTSTSSTTSSTTTSSTSTTTTTTLPPGPAVGGTWTLMLYMLGDNNLEPAMFPDIQELAQLPEDDGLTVVALVDRSDEYSDREMFNLADWTTAKLLTVELNSLTEIDDWGEVNMGDPAVLADFVAAAADIAPADHYAVVLWDHGAITGVGNDESSNDGLNPFEIAEGLEDGLGRAGIDRLDFIGFDACMMGAYEVATVVAPYAYYMIGSEENEPNGGWNYEAFDYISFHPDDGTVEALGLEILDRFIELEAEGTPKVTLSLLDLDEIGGVHETLDLFAAETAASMEAYALTIAQQRRDTMSFAGNPDPSKDWHMIDMGDFLERLSAAEPALEPAAGAVLDAIDAAVVGSATGTLHEGANGISVYFPPVGDYWIPQYEPLIPEPWLTFVQAFYDAGAAIPANEQPDFQDAGNLASFELTDDSLTLLGEFNIAAEATAVEVTLYNGIPEEDGTVTYYGETQGILEGNLAGGIYNLTVLQLSDGEDSAIAYMDASFDPTITYLNLDVPVAYYPPGDDEWIDAVISVYYDSETDELSQTMYQIDEDGYWGVLFPEPDGLIAPWLLIEDTDGSLTWELSTDIGLWADLDNLTWDWITLEAGTPLYAELWVCDYGGNCDWVWAQTTVGSGESGGGGGSGDRATCTNDALFGFEFEYPSWLSVWDPVDPDLACHFFNTRPFSAADDQGAYDEAALTVEFLEGQVLADFVQSIYENSDQYDQFEVEGFPYGVVAFEGAEAGIYGYIVPISEGDAGPAFVITAWEQVDPAADLRSAADMVLQTIDW